MGTVAFYPFFSLLVFLITSEFYCPTISFAEANSNTSISIELIHRNSPKCPFYNPSATTAELARKDAFRSLARVRRFNALSTINQIDSPMITDAEDGEYLTRISIGTPPVDVIVFVDTGSDLAWVQCGSCDGCDRKQKSPFNPQQSSSYAKTYCESVQCNSLDEPFRRCGQSDMDCGFYYHYADQSYTSGVLATETFTFASSGGQKVSYSQTAFGCANDSHKTSHASGVVGLGGGPLSLVSQLGDHINHRFIYCLMPSWVDGATILRFGGEMATSGTGVVTTRLIPNETTPTYYYLGLEAITLGGKKVFNNHTDQCDGKVIIDSGSMLTFLEQHLYFYFEGLVRESIDLPVLADPEGAYLLCYKTKDFMSLELTTVFQFAGANLTLNKDNIFIAVGKITCLALYPAQGPCILGNLAQVNFQVEYDLAKNQVSFASTDCTKQQISVGRVIESNLCVWALLITTMVVWI